MSAKDVFFISSNDINDGHREDSASVNAQAHSKIRRRKWNVRFECGSDLSVSLLAVQSGAL